MDDSIKIDSINQELIDQIIVGLAHELNNPNAAIRMNAMNLIKMISLLGPCMDEYAGRHPEQRFGPYTLPELRSKIVQQGESILQATIRIVTIADKLKQCSADWLEQSSAICLKQVVKDVIAMHQFLLDRCAKIDFLCDSGGRYEIVGHKLQLEQALSVLMTNACDAISERFLENNPDRSHEVHGHIIINMSESEDRVLLIFSDNGAGMTPEIMKKIFAPYFTTKPQGIGDGLGLPICQAIIVRHGGEIEVKSTRHVGTQFMMTLPKDGKRAPHGSA